MRHNTDVLKDIATFYNSIKTKEYSALNLDEDVKKFQGLRDEVIGLFEDNSLFNKPIYHSSDFDYNYESMRVACDEMMKLIMEEGL